MATKKEVTGIFRRGGFSSKIHLRKLFLKGKINMTTIKTCIVNDYCCL